MGTFTAPKGLPKMSTGPGWASFFIALFVFEEDGNNKNNGLDLNVSKVNYIQYVYVLYICFSVLIYYCIFEIVLTALKQCRFVRNKKVKSPPQTASLFFQEYTTFVIVFTKRSFIFAASVQYSYAPDHAYFFKSNSVNFIQRLPRSPAVCAGSTSHKQIWDFFLSSFLISLVFGVVCHYYSRRRRRRRTLSHTYTCRENQS